MDIKTIAKQILESAQANFFSPAPTEKVDVEKHIDATAKPRTVRKEIQDLARAMVDRNRSKHSNFKSNEPLSPELAEVQEEKKKQSTIVTYEKGRAGADSRAQTSQMMNAAFSQPKEHTPASKKPKQNIEGASKEKEQVTPSNPLIQSFEQKSDIIQENRAIDFGMQKVSGIGTFLTARDLGMKIQAGFALHPSVEEELERRDAERNN